MNKRKYPYDIDMCPQLKIHVGDKQIANGVLGQSKMSEIYEKTKQFLFQGAASQAPFEEMVQSVIINETLCDSKPSKQLQLTFDGKLMFKPDVLVKNLNVCNEIQQKCSYCSKIEKLDFCDICKDIFCNMCSLCSDKANRICLTCYK